MIQVAMFISIVICTYNRCRYLSDTLNCLLKLRTNDQFQYEIIVIDNNSKDDTRQVIQSYTGKFPVSFKYIFEEKQGLSHARNTGVNESRGDIIAFTDDDVFVDENWLVNICKAFKEHHCIGIGGKILPYWPGNKIPWWFDHAHKQAYVGVTCDMDLGDSVQEFKRDYSSPYGANMIFKKTAFAQYGYFKTNLGRKGNDFGLNEDSEFGNRLLEAEEHLLYIPDVFVLHRVLPERLNPDYLRKWHFSFGKSKTMLPGKDVVNSYIGGIPRYLFRKVFENAGKVVINYFCLNFKKAFLWELRVRSTIGQMVGFHQGYKKV